MKKGQFATGRWYGSDQVVEWEEVEREVIDEDTDIPLYLITYKCIDEARSMYFKVKGAFWEETPSTSEVKRAIMEKYDASNYCY